MRARANGSAAPLRIVATAVIADRPKSSGLAPFYSCIKGALRLFRSAAGLSLGINSAALALGTAKNHVKVGIRCLL